MNRTEQSWNAVTVTLPFDSPVKGAYIYKIQTNIIRHSILVSGRHNLNLEFQESNHLQVQLVLYTIQYTNVYT